MSMGVYFFATRKDLLSVFSEIENIRSIHYCEAGMFDQEELHEYRSVFDIPEFGLMRVADTNLGTHFLIADNETLFNLRAVPQRRGGIRYAVDQGNNPDSVGFFPGGQYNEETILSGSISTCTDSPISKDLFGIMKKAVRRKWVRIQSFYVSPDAESVLDSGGRLTSALRSPREYDLRR